MPEQKWWKSVDLGAAPRKKDCKLRCRKSENMAKKIDKAPQYRSGQQHNSKKVELRRSISKF